MASLLALTGGFTGFVYRFLVWSFLRLIPGRQGTYLLPAFFLLNSLCFYYNSPTPTKELPTHRVGTTEVESERPATPTSGAKTIISPGAPTFAQIAATEPTSSDNEIVLKGDAAFETVSTGSTASTPTSPSSAAGSLRRRKKKKQIKALDSEEPTDALIPLEDEPERKLPQSDVTLRSLVSNLVLSTPSHSIFLNRVTLAINVFLLGLCLDALWTPILGQHEHDLAFARVGAVDHMSAKVFARVPPVHTALTAEAVQSTNDTTLFAVLSDQVDSFAGARVVYRPTKPLGKWIDGGDLRVEENRDYTGVLHLKGLWAQTEYEFRLLRPTLSSSQHPSFPSTYSFTTFPDPALSSAGSPGAGTHFSFVSTSCVKPGFPYTGPWNKKSIKGARLLKKVVEEKGFKFMLMLGDFIYADVPFYAGPSVAQYQKRYRQTFGSPDMLALLEKLPSLYTKDDHEIRNDFSSQESDPSFATANAAYRDYLGSANPSPVDEGEDYYSFRHGDAAFFVWDTRRYRSKNSAIDDEHKTMLGQKQRESFEKWLKEVNNTVTWKFVASSVPFNSLWNHGQDTWAGFLSERDAIMDTLQYVPNVIVLSGDRHEFAAASIRTTVTEFSTSPLNMFYLPIRTLSQANNRGATGEDVLLNYLPDGNHKFTTFEVDTRVVNQPLVRVQVYIDGQVAWQVEVRGVPIRSPMVVPRAIGSLGKSLLELLGFKKRKWF
ncbi:BQ5605_C012g07010 [Microbotryum silenes-dioicae]|uniref:BQ5605_C012g07010 protein n=1 Tax=Microbotryum silenes-dioicae TaxID=796604 RepID=A0A2X0NVR8_9BASI|nr:BQ5605_C012g07010 [Microbotryum silenes-dioicae]